MAQSWPLSLQQKINQAGFTNGFGNTVLRSEMDLGPEKRRQRQTRGNDSLSTSIDLDKDEYITLELFFKTTLAGGSLNFDFDHPISGDSEEFNMKEPSIVPLGGLVYRVSMVWEQQT